MPRLSYSLLLFCLTCPTGASADLYQWTDSMGVIHIVDESVEVPAEFRASVKVYRATKRSVSERAQRAEPAEQATKPSSTGMTLLPSRSFAENTQGSFAQKLARDLGLIEGENEDALTVFTGVGISPAGGWKVYDPLSREVAYEVIASARRAAESRRLSLSADGAEGVVWKTLDSFVLEDAPQEEPPAEKVGFIEEEVYEPVMVEYVQERVEIVPQPYYSPFLPAGGIPRRSPASRPINSGRPPLSTPPLPLRQPPPFPFASPHPGVRR